jgi:uncharacterized protein (UPF0332 family)
MTPDAPQPEPPFAKREAELLSRVREQYVAEGYEVFSGLPIEKDDPLSVYRPDLVLKKGSDVIVIELKHSLETRDTEDLQKLRAQIESHPGWRFRLLFAGDPFQAYPTTVRPGSKATSEIRRRISNARRLFDSVDYAGAITFLWIAIETALRSYFAKSGELPTSGVTALSMLRRLYEEGMVTETDYKVLTESYRLRSNAVHGFKVQVRKRDAERMLKIAEALIQRLGKEGSGH